MMSDKRKQDETSKPTDFSEKEGRIEKTHDSIRDSYPPPKPSGPKPVDKPPKKD